MESKARITTTAKSPRYYPLNLTLDDFDMPPKDKIKKLLLRLKKEGFRGGSSKYKGVQKKEYVKRKHKYIHWIVNINYNGQRIAAKCFPYTPEGEKQAALFYDETTIELRGEHAYTNQMAFPEDFKE